MKLDAKDRNALPSKSFALPGRRYPINDESHGKAALSMAHYASPAEQATIRNKVHEKFPSIGKASSQARVHARIMKAHQKKD